MNLPEQYKAMMEQVSPEEQLLSRTRAAMQQELERKDRAPQLRVYGRRYALVAACLLITILAVVPRVINTNTMPQDEAQAEEVPQIARFAAEGLEFDVIEGDSIDMNVTTGGGPETGGGAHQDEPVHGVMLDDAALLPQPPQDTVPVYLPAVEIPTNTDTANLGPMIVYNGGIYTHRSSGRGMPYANAEALKGESLGVTAGGIDAYRNQGAGGLALPSTTTGMEVYTVQGYDSDFRLMGLRGEEIWFFEQLNDITIASGADVFEKLQIRGNVQLVEVQSQEDWSESVGEYRRLAFQDDVLDHFVDALYETSFSLMESKEERALVHQQPNAFLYLVLEDGSEVVLRLYRGGVIEYSECPGFFWMDREIFDMVFNQIV